MKRRFALHGFAAALAAAAPMAHAQQPAPRRKRLGLMIPGSSASDRRRLSALRAGLTERGWNEPATLELVVRFADGELERFPELAAELVAAQVDVILTSSTSGLRAAAGATQTIPIVAASASDLLASGLIAGLARPGGNVTGLSQARLDTGAKEVELAAELLPGLTRIGVLRGPAGGAGAQVFEALRAAAATRGIMARSYEAQSPSRIDAAFAAMATAGEQAVLIVDGPLTSAQRDRIAGLASGHRMPVISSSSENVRAGTLASYGPDAAVMWRRSAYYVDRLFRGAVAAELPVEQPTAFELTINRDTATALGLTIPQAILLRADEVIE
jgi:putative ABC transport system substrate-binding protein